MIAGEERRAKARPAILPRDEEARLGAQPMRLPADAAISMEKLTNYLLMELPRGDKSRFLAHAGYTGPEAGRLERDLREQILCLEATPLASRGYGDLYEICGFLRGPNGREVAVRTIWMREHETGIVKFITLIPLGRERL